MKRASLAVILAAAALSGQTLGQHDREFALSHLHATRKMLLDAIAGLSQAQWKFKPAPERWSIAECAEHVALSEDFMFQRVQNMLKVPASPDKKPQFNEEEVMRAAADRTQKVKSSEPSTQPRGRWAAAAALSRHFKERRDRTLQYVRTTQDPLRSHFLGSGTPTDALDAYQWLLQIAGHTERHVAQINEVKADPRFPK
jgi:uncharacterized damage-inducible protein DinB